MKYDIKDYGLEIYVQIVTPKAAKEMLDHQAHPKNRKISEANVANYGRMMKNGDWMINGEAIAIQSDGIIANGHNRLHAVIRSGVPVAMLIIKGVPPSAFTTYDCGQTRKASHVLQMDSVPNATNIAAIVSSTMIYREAIARKGSYNTYLLPTNSEILAEYNNHPQLYQTAYTFAAKTKGICSASSLGMVYSYALIDRRYDCEAVEEFAASLTSGEMLRMGNPILTLRNMLILARSEKAASKSGRTRNWYKNACITAWNAYTEGRDLRLIKVMDANKAIQIK